MRRVLSRGVVLLLVAAAFTTVGPVPAARADDVFTIGGGPWRVRSCSSTVCDSLGIILDGPILDPICQVAGEEVYLGGSQRSAVWDKVRTVGGDVGFVTDLAVMETTLGSFDPRLPRCTGDPGQVAYYQPRETIGVTPPYWDPVVDPSVAIPRASWSNGYCGTSSGYNFPEMTTEGRVTTLAGWSLGRLGPTYVLNFNEARSATVNFIVLYDPGGHVDYEAPSCDIEFDQSDLYIRWLRRHPNNQLLILAGEETRDEDHLDRATYEGISDALFPQIAGTPQSLQALVCSYDDLGHQDVVRKFSSVASQGRRSSCPQADGADFAAAFHPGQPGPDVS